VGPHENEEATLLKQQLQLLEELQRHDARLQEQENVLKTLPEKLQTLKNDLAKFEALLLKERAGLAETEKFRRDLEGQLKTDENNIARSKSKLTQVKTSKDYMAAQREIETTRKMLADREEELLKLIEVVEAAKKTIAGHENDIAELRGHVATEEQSTETRLAEVRAQTAGARTERDAIASQVKPDVLKKYSTIRLRRGLAVVPVLKGVCQGCHMSIPPQLFNLLQRGTSIEFCPQCARIIYWSELMKDKELEAGENEKS
jgi:predicted  nucleic acid-binding Zn-ribbon protein